MKSNYKRLGDYIQELKIRNTEQKAEKLLGINIDKFFMPSVANVVGTDLSVYKIVKKNQFACNRMHVGRDYRLPISMSKTDEEFMVSPAYDVFEIKDTEVLHPEFLMMWFSRREFDRNAWFYTDADVRGGLPWKSLCDIQLPIPHISKQREIVKEYNVIQNRIALNQQLIQKLEETAMAIYKQWFVEFEFPDETGKPYKSNGGVMVWCEELGKEIPRVWGVKSYEEVFSFKTGKLNSDAAISNGEFPFFTCSQETFKTNTFSFDCEALILAGNNASAIYPFKYFKGKFDAYQRTYIITPKESCVSIYQGYFEILGRLEEFKGTSSGTATKFLTMQILNPLKIVEPEEQICNKFTKTCRPVFSGKLLAERNISSLTELKELLLSKLATIEN